MKLRYLSTVCTLALFAGDLAAQAMLEEVVVTARKRAESLHDVPISVSVTSGEKLERMGIGGLEELSAYTPNVHISENATQQSVTIRGIGSGANQAFEQSVGTYVDGVYYGRGRSARNPFFDIERIEILKGPQGILFGKNTIAGAINITTRRPTEEFEAHLMGEYFSEVDQWGVSAIVSGPLSHNVRGRLAVNSKESDGFVKNTFTGKEEGGRDESLVRASLEWDATDDLTVFMKAETGSFDVDGRNTQMIVPSALAGLFSTIDPNFETKLDDKKSSVGASFDNTDTANFTLKLDYEVNDQLTLTSITAYVDYDFEYLVGAEFGPLQYIDITHEQEFEQVSEEFRFQYISEDDRFELLGGLYYQNEELFMIDSFNFILSNLNAQGLPFPALDVSVPNFFDQETDSIAAFIEATYRLTDDLEVSLGVRSSRDEKDMDKRLYFADLYTTNEHATINGPFLGRVEHRYSLDREDTDTSPSIGFKYDLSNDHMVYATYSEGYKSGGFDQKNPGGTLALSEFDPEEAEAWEIGGKFTFLDGAMKVNVAAFKNEYQNLQVSAWNGQVFIVSNAGSATAEGLEADFQWRVTEDFTLGGAAAWLNAEYDKFTGAACSAAQTAVWAGAGSCVQNLSGKELQFSPDFAGNLNAEYVIPMDRFVLTFGADVNYTSSFFTALDLDPASKQDSFTKLNLRVELADVDDSWSVALVGKNLSDKTTTSWVNDVPIFGGHFALVDPPRSVGVQFKLSM